MFIGIDIPNAKFDMIFKKKKKWMHMNWDACSWTLKLTLGQ